MCSYLKSTAPYSILMFGLYTQTFVMFPGVMLKKQLSFCNANWGSILLVLVYNSADTLGRYTVPLIKRPDGLLLSYSLFFLRFINIACYVLIAVKFDQLPWFQSDWFALLNSFIFAFLNGLGTTIYFISGPLTTKKSGIKKETIGFVMVLMLVLGITIGSYAALPLKNLGGGSSIWMYF